jgi:hypothetical protein
MCYSSYMATTAKKLSKRVRRLSLSNARTKQALRGLAGWPAQVGTMQAQLASITAILSVVQDELEANGTKDFPAKVQAKAQQMVQEWSKAREQNPR